MKTVEMERLMRENGELKRRLYNDVPGFNRVDMSSKENTPPNDPMNIESPVASAKAFVQSPINGPPLNPKNNGFQPNGGKKTQVPVGINVQTPFFQTSFLDRRDRSGR